MGLTLSDLRDVAKREVDGIWRDWYAGARLKIARLGNPRYSAKMRKLGRDLPRLAKRAVLEDKTLDQIEEHTRHAYAETILLDWSGLCDDDGIEIKYTPQKSYEFLTEFNNLYLDVQEMAGDAEVFRETQTEGAEKN